MIQKLSFLLVRNFFQDETGNARGLAGNDFQGVALLKVSEFPEFLQGKSEGLRALYEVGAGVGCGGTSLGESVSGRIRMTMGAV